MDSLAYGFAGLGLIAVLIGSIIGIIVLICFFFLCRNVSLAKKYLSKLYFFEKYRLIEDGHLNPETNQLIKWKFDENDYAHKRDEINEESKK